MSSPEPVTYTLNRDKLSGDCVDHMDKFLGTQSVELSEAVVFPPPENMNCQVTQQGHGKLLNVECSIESLLYKPDDDRLLLIVCARPTQKWEFGDCFPFMPKPDDIPAIWRKDKAEGFYLRYLTLDEPRWVYVYSSGVNEKDWEQINETIKAFWDSNERPPDLKEKSGLSMWGTLPEVLPGLETLTAFVDVPKLSLFPIEANVSYPKDLPIIKLHIPLGEKKELVFTEECKLTDVAVALSSPLFFSPHNLQICLTARLQLFNSEIDFEVDFPLQEDLITAKVDYKGIPFVEESESWPKLPLKDEIQLEMQFSKREKKLKKVGFQLEIKNWQIIDSILTLKDILFSFSVFDPFGSKMVIASITAQAELCQDVQLKCAGFYPSGQFSFYLDSAKGLKLGHLIEKMLGHSAGLSDLAIRDIGAEYNLRTTAFSILVDVSEVWTIHDVFKLQNLLFTIQRHGNGTSYCRVAATLSIADVTVYVGAAYSDSTGWQFEGSTGAGQEIPIGRLIEDLAGKFSADKPQLPAALANLVVQDLGVSFNTKSKDFHFTCTASSENLSSTLTIDVKHQDGNYEMELGGDFEVKLDEDQSLRFALQYKREQNEQEKTRTQAFVASYHHTGELPLSISALVARLAPGDTGLEVIVRECLNVKIDLRSVVFACYKESSTELGANGKSPEPTKLLFGLTLDIGASVDLSGLPLVGDELASIAVEDLQLLIASQPFADQDVETINGLLPEGVTQLPVTAKPTEPEKPKPEPTKGKPTEEKAPSPPALAKGINLSALLKLGEGESTPLVLSPSGGEEQAGKPAPEESAPAAKSIVPTTPSSVKWIKIQKSFGPVRFERIGFQFQSRDQVIWFLLDASLSAAGLTVSLEGFGFGSSITQFKPRFELQGLGINFKNDPVEVSGAFLKTGDNQYSGQALIKGESFMLSAIGQYANVEGIGPSMFIFAYLDTPLGGPPCFYVTGLAAGFGYNSSLRTPAIEEVKDFPLLAAMVDPSKIGIQKDKPADPMDVLASLCQWIQPQRGMYWLAAGITFRSFEIIKSNVLAIVEFGKEFQVLVVGLSTLRLPQEGDRIYAYAELMILITIKPAQGFIAAMAQLTPNSYLLDPACHLTGGFAFYVWFGNNPYAGDFVLTIGGYHPDFKVPAHYPQPNQVPRLGFNWVISSSVTIKGEAYFALTPSCIMAGGRLDVLYHSGSLNAWFIAQADTIVYWKPFYFDVRIAVRIGVSYRTIFGTLKIELGAAVELWGPPTGGKARITCYFISFTVSFGNGRRTGPSTVDWAGFKTMLPIKKTVSAADSPSDGDLAVIQINVNNGLLPQMDGENGKKRWIVRADEFAFSIETAIPATETRLNKQNLVITQDNEDNEDNEEQPMIGIRPMGIREIDSPLTISICRGDQQDPLPIGEWDYESHSRKMPEAMWGKPVNGNLQPGNGLVENCMVGLRNIRCKPPAPPKGPPKFVMEDAFGYFTISPVEGKDIPDYLPLSPAGTEPATGFPTTNDTLQVIHDTLMDGTVKQRRMSICQALAEMGVNAFTDGDLSTVAANPAANYEASPMKGTLMQEQ